LIIYPRLVKIIPNLKVIVITGPYFQKFNNRSFSHLRIIRFENNLPELMKLSKLVISTAGYNTCNELIQAKTPAVLVPLWRGGREQFERALYLEKNGIVRVFNGNSSSQFLDLVINCKKNLEKMRLNFRKFSHYKQGNTEAAKIILKLLKK
jgi:predicted glycosyltransferase